MVEPLIGTVACFSFPFAPRGWLQCWGQMLPLSSNSALFAVIGSTYGGDGRQTFALPDLRGYAPIGFGTQPDQDTSYMMGQRIGQPTAVMSLDNMPAHTHTTTFNILVSDDDPNTDSPLGNYLTTQTDGNMYNSTPTPGQFATGMIVLDCENAGSGQPIDIMSPYMALNYCISVQGAYPSR